MIRFEQVKTGQIILDSSWLSYLYFTIIGEKESETVFKAKEYSMNLTGKDFNIKDIHFSKEHGFSPSHEIIDGRYYKKLIRRILE